MLLTEVKSVIVDEREVKWCFSALSSPEYGVSTCHSLESPHKNFCQTPAITLAASEFLLSRQHNTPVFYLRHRAGFKNCKLQILGTHAFAICQFVQEKWSVACLPSASEFMVKLSKNPAPRFAAFDWCLCSYAREWGGTLALPVLCVSRESRPPFLNALQAGGTVSSCAIQGFFRPHCLLQGLHPPP